MNRFIEIIPADDNFICEEVRNDNRKPKKAHIRDIDECRRYCWDKVADTLKNKWSHFWWCEWC